jgi:hypothetical protein
MCLGYGGVEDNNLVEVKVNVKKSLYRPGESMGVP